MEEDVIVRKIRQKSQELEDLEDAFHQAIRKVEEGYQDNYALYQGNLRKLEQEAEEARYLVKTMGLEEQDFLMVYLNGLSSYSDEFEVLYKRREMELAEREEDLRTDFRKQRDRYEREIESLRRDYGSSLE